MPQVIKSHTPSTRRGSLQFSVAAIVAGFTISAVAGDANSEAELIALCNRIVAVCAEQAAVAKANPWAPDDGPLSGKYHDLHDEWIMLVDRLQSAKRPTTPVTA
jgi:hypothetical protein